MGNYSVPEAIRKLESKGIMVKKIKPHWFFNVTTGDAIFKLHAHRR